MKMKSKNLMGSLSKHGSKDAVDAEGEGRNKYGMSNDSPLAKGLFNIPRVTIPPPPRESPAAAHTMPPTTIMVVVSPIPGERGRGAKAASCLMLFYTTR